MFVFKGRIRKCFTLTLHEGFDFIENYRYMGALIFVINSFTICKVSCVFQLTSFNLTRHDKLSRLTIWLRLVIMTTFNHKINIAQVLLLIAQIINGNRWKIALSTAVFSQFANNLQTGPQKLHGPVVVLSSLLSKWHCVDSFSCRKHKNLCGRRLRYLSMVKDCTVFLSCM